MIDSPWFPTLLVVLCCAALVIMQALVRGAVAIVGGNRGAWHGAIMFLLIAYITIGAGLALYLAISGPLVEGPDVEYDSRDFIR